MDTLYTFALFTLLLIGCRAVGCEYFKPGMKYEEMESKPDAKSIDNYKAICQDQEKYLSGTLQDMIAERKNLYTFGQKITNKVLQDDAWNFVNSVDTAILKQMEEDACGQKVDWDKRGKSNDFVNRQTERGTYNKICDKSTDWTDEIAEEYATMKFGLTKMTSGTYQNAAKKYFEKKLKTLRGDTGKFAKYEAKLKQMQAADKLRESETLEQQLARLKKTMVDVPGDGNCFFHAASRQMIEKGISNDNHKEVRAKAFEYLTEHPAEFSKGAITGAWPTILANIARNKNWADDHAISAVCKAYDITIIIYQGRGIIVHGASMSPKPTECGEIEKCIEIAYTGDHYRQVFPLVESSPHQISALKAQIEKALDAIVKTLKTDFDKWILDNPKNMLQKYESQFVEFETFGTKDNLDSLKRKIKNEFKKAYNQRIGKSFVEENMNVDVNKGERIDDWQMNEYNVVVTYNAPQKPQPQGHWLTSKTGIITIVVVSILITFCVCGIVYRFCAKKSVGNNDRALAATPVVALCGHESGGNNSQNIRHRNSPQKHPSRTSV